MVTQVIQSNIGGLPNRVAVDQFITTGQMDWTRFENTDVVAAAGGTATSFTGVIERSAVDPNSPVANPLSGVTPADSTGLTGNLTTGITPNVYREPGVGWWRIRVTACSGGSANTSISGQSS